MCAACGFAIPGLIAACFPPRASLTTNPVAAQLLAVASTAVKSRSNLGSLTKFEVAIVLLPALVCAVATSRARTLRILDFWTGGAVISATAATLDLVHITHISQSLLGFADSRQSGLTLQPNHLALGAVLALPVTVTWLARSRGWRILGVVSSSLLAAGIYAARSRGAEVLAPAAILFGFLIVPRLRRWLAMIAPVAALAMIAGLLAFGGTLSSALSQARLTSQASGVVESDQQRSQIRVYSLEAFEARPVTGVGYTVIDDAHNVYIQLLASGGIIGLASFLTVLGCSYGMVRRLRGTEDQLVGAALGATLTVYALDAFVENQITDRYLYVPLGVLVALVALRPVAPAPAYALLSDPQATTLELV